jgi:hypothetical protein
MLRMAALWRDRVRELFGPVHGKNTKRLSLFRFRARKDWHEKGRADAVSSSSAAASITVSKRKAPTNVSPIGAASLHRSFMVDQIFAEAPRAIRMSAIRILQYSAPKQSDSCQACATATTYDRLAEVAAFR